MDFPLVSVIVTTYNHGKFIEQCLKSVLMQDTSFPFELIVGVDEGEDNTLEICKKIEQSDPRVKVVLNDSANVTLVNGKRIGRSNFLNVLKLAKGKYIARCDGDDYWIDPLKLQKQVDFLQAHPEVSLVFTNRTIIEDEKEIPNNIAIRPGKYTRKDVINGLVAFAQTSMYKFDIALVDFLVENNDIQGGDYLITYFYSMKGDIYYLSDLKTAVYRRNGGGIWTTKSKLEMQVMVVKQMFKLKERLKIETSSHIYRKIGKDLVHYFLNDRSNLSDYIKQSGISKKTRYYSYAYGFVHLLNHYYSNLKKKVSRS